MNILSNALASLANVFSGTEPKATWFLWFAETKCPEELIK